MALFSHSESPAVSAVADIPESVANLNHTKNAIIQTTENSKKTFTVILIRASKYDEEGYVIRYRKGVLPSNTLGVLAALAQRAFDEKLLGAHVHTQLAIFDDVVHVINVHKMAKRYLGKNKRAVVCFCGVQSNQFPRAMDLAKSFKEAGFEVMVGGFHVSGIIATSPNGIPEEIQTVMDQGITVVKGEVEDVFGNLLVDAFTHQLRPLYNFEDKPNLDNAPIPLIDMRYQSRFVYPHMGTIDASRGCPYSCSFCTIINVQGRKMRCRSAKAIAEQIESNYQKHKIDYYFFTDDNFARNPNRDEILEALIELRSRGIHITFMMQVDTKAWKIPNFISQAAAAGCTQIFVGIETLNEGNLKAASKGQNNSDEYKEMISAWQHHGIACHGTLIIGFPEDSPESVKQDVEILKEIGLDQVSFFMLTPLPGSSDHAKWRSEGIWMDSDYNNYDSCHETLQLPNFAPGEWRKAWDDAWHEFYSFDNMKTILKRCNERTYWGIFKNFMWYLNSIDEGLHPMVAGFRRIKTRTDRRPGFPIENWFKHTWRRLSDATHKAGLWLRFFYMFQELWLQTRLRPAAGAAATDLREHWAHTKRRLKKGLLGIAERALLKWDRARRKRYLESRKALNDYWHSLAQDICRARVFKLLVGLPKMFVNLVRETRLSMTFLICVMHDLIHI